MKMLTFRLKPKTIFGLILILTGIVVISVTFLSNHISNPGKEASKPVVLETDAQREEFLSSVGLEFSTQFEQKEITIPMEFNETYIQYNEIQKGQGFDLEPFKGKTATVFTYNIKNYPDYENRDCIFANLIVCNGALIGGDICSTSAKDGFIKALK